MRLVHYAIIGSFLSMAIPLTVTGIVIGSAFMIAKRVRGDIVDVTDNK